MHTVHVGWVQPDALFYKMATSPSSFLSLNKAYTALTIRIINIIMASNSLDEATHKQSFSIDDLAARSVTLYPTRAAVVRDIENVTIEVSLYCLHAVSVFAD